MSQIATTREQSEMLRKAGIGEDTADMTYQDDMLICKSYTSAVDFENSWRSHGGSPHNIQAPAWSLSRLIDIRAEVGSPFNYGPMTNGSAAVIECLVDSIVDLLKYRR